MTEAMPRITLTSTSRLPRNVEFALYRRIIEIRDGGLALRQHIPTKIFDWVAEEADRAGIVDERRITVLQETALASKQAGHRWDNEHVLGSPPEVEADVESETAWLTSVSRAYATSPIIPEIRRRTAAELSLQKAR